MKVVLQRVSRASVAVGDETVGAIGPGLLVLVCAVDGDGDGEARLLAAKVARMRIFVDDEGRMNRSLIDIGGAALVVSQFTLAARWRKGNRPSFSDAAAPAEGERLYGLFCDALSAEGVAVETGRFGAAMEVALVNDGPVTIWMDSAEG